MTLFRPAQAILVGLGLIVWAVIAFARPANADEAHMRMYHATADQDDWMRSLTRPDTKTSCCNLSDCSPTDADWRDGQWWAVIRGSWTPIPPGKVVKSPLSIDGEAWVCAGQTVVFCFIPPLNSY